MNKDDRIRELQAEVERLRALWKKETERAHVAEGELLKSRVRLVTIKQERDQLKAEVPPNESGSNRYGLDCSYFRGVINRELNRPLVDFKPDELARVLMRMAVTADAAVLSEPEFLRRMDLSARDAEVIVRAINECAYKTLQGDIINVECIREYANQLRQKAKEVRHADTDGS